MIEVSINNLFDRQKEVINEILESLAKFHAINASRQSGKTFTLSDLAVIFGLSLKNDSVLIVSPTYEQVKIIFNNIMAIKNIEKVIVSKKESKPFELKLITGTVLSFKSADRPDSLRGGSNRIILCDEFAFFKKGIFETILRPSTAAKKNSKIIVASTPKGTENTFYDIVQLAQDGNANYNYITMHYSDNPYYDLNEVKDAKLRLPEQIYLQEYEGVFITSGGDVFSGIDKVMVNNDIIPPVTNASYFAGIDWGRADDSTVLTILDKNRNTVYLEAYTGDWPKQINNMAIVLNKYKPIVYAESNGIGDPLIAQLRSKYSNVQPFVMSNSSKKEIVEELRMAILLKEIKLMSSSFSKELFSQLTNYTFSITKTGLITYHHRIGEHDDYVDSTCIANYCYKKHNVSSKGITFKHNNDFYNDELEEDFY